MEHARALASVHPCELYLDHGSARPSRTQGHHAFAEFLQKRLWGEVRDTTITWLCGTCHDSVHDWLYWLLGEWREPTPHPSPRAKASAKAAFDRYQLERAA